MLIDKRQKKQVEEVVNKWFNAIIYKIAGPQDLSTKEKNELLEANIISKQEDWLSYVQEAYHVGRVRAPKEGKYAKSDLNKFRIFESRLFIPKSQKEKLTIDHIKESAGNYITKLRDSARGIIEGAINNANAKFLQESLLENVKEVVEDNVRKKKGVKQLARDLRDGLDDMNRDWERVAVSELSSAFNNGAADAIAQRNKGKSDKQVYVAKIVSKDEALCEHCRSLYLLSNGSPRVYKLSDMKAAGTNHGRKASEYKPTIGPLHPRCRCTLVEVPVGFGFKTGTQTLTYMGPDYDPIKDQKD